MRQRSDGALIAQATRVSANQPTRLAYMDGLRGFAAVQVVVLHYTTFFSDAIGNIDPTVPHPAWQNSFIHSPLFFFGDGYMALPIFFLISGAVLTYSFEASAASFVSQMARRVVRLGVPLAASVLLAAFWIYLMPQAHHAAGVLLHDT